MGKVYPSLYVMIVAPPGWCRKSVPVGFAKDILKELQLPVYVDSPTKRAFTKKLDALSRQHHYKITDPDTGLMISQPQAPLSCISKELSSFLAINPKEMIEALTDLYDEHDTWDYETSGAGEDHITAPYINCLFATTPKWMASNLPPEAIGGGFTSRFVMVAGTERYKILSDPPPGSPALYRDLIHDLNIISMMTGEFKWGEGAYRFFDQWYQGLGQAAKEIMDERVQPFLSRIHTIAIKTAMCLHVAYADTFIIEIDDIERAIRMLTDVTKKASSAFSSHGRSRSAVDTDRIMAQLGQLKKLSFSDLLRINYRNTNKLELIEILESLEAMGNVQREDAALPWYAKKQVILWKGLRED
uniref:DUF3987 domain-containing protein n=1 Tax=viral metagenome TaxID=1070528 RepID=A0A6M3L1U7_9ZZZZ